MITPRTLGLGLVAAALFSLGPARPAAAQTYDAAGDFSATSNPNGVWSYGYETTLGGTFTLYTNKITEAANTAGWNKPILVDFPFVVKNFGTIPSTYADVVLAPGQLSLHPGPNDEFSIVRFTAPTAGLYNITANWYAVTTDGTTTDANVLFAGLRDATFINNQVTGTLNNPTNSPSYAKSVALTAGETVDFAVGFGNDGGYFRDSTGFDAHLTNTPAVPEASTTVSFGLLLALGLGGAALGARKKRAAHEGC